jgi:cyclic dehypoxanthinyl futalosine synthase
MGISRQQALECFRSDDLVGVGMEADAVRRRLHPEGVVSYAIDARKRWPAPGAEDDFYLAIAEAVTSGATGLRLVGEAGGADVEALLVEESLRGVRQRFPALWIEALSPAGLKAIAAGWGIELTPTLKRLQDAGLDAIAADGPDLRAGFEDWVELHRAAHGAGMRTVASLVFGAGETVEQRVDFLEAVARLQGETGGFAAFAPVAAEAPNGRQLDGVTAVERLKTLAISRMFLETVENVQASAAGGGLKVLQMGLRFGANDVGGLSLPGGASEEDVRRIIRDAGFRPAQRTMAYAAMMLG